MSTAGKVLAVLVMLISVVWIILSADVDQLNTNANTKLHDLTAQVEKLEADVEKTQDEVVTLKNSTSSLQERLDHEATVLPRSPNGSQEKALASQGSPLTVAI